jgi:hypothetical protein
MDRLIHPRGFNHAAIWCEVAGQYRQATFKAKGIFQITDTTILSISI